jgi:hypothetical protein
MAAIRYGLVVGEAMPEDEKTLHRQSCALEVISILKSFYIF